MQTPHIEKERIPHLTPVVEAVASLRGRPPPWLQEGGKRECDKNPSQYPSGHNEGW